MKTLLSIVLLLAAAMGLNAQAVQRSLLANPMDASTNTVYIYSSQIPQSLSQGYVYIDSEVMLVKTTFLSPSVVTSNSIVILTVARGYLGTTPAAHGTGSLVLYGYPSQFLAADPTGPCVPYGVQYLSYLNQRFFSCGPNSTWFAVTTSNAMSAASLSNGTTGSGEIVLQNTPTIVSPSLTGTPLVNGLKIGAFRVIALPSSCVAGSDPAVVFDSGGQDAGYFCDNTGHYALPPGGSTTILGGAVTGSGGANVIASGQNGLVLSGASGTSTTAVAAPSGAVVGTTDTQTLTHKNLADGTNVFPTFNQNTTGNAVTATTANSAATAETANSLAATPSTCTLGYAPTGIIANGNATGCNPTEACLNIIAFGGNNQGTGSNNAAWTAVLAAGTPDHQCIYFPRGNYLFATTPVWNAPSGASSITVRGDGQDVTQLFFVAGQNGLTLALQATTNSVRVHGMSIRTNGVNSGFGLVIQGLQTANAEGVQSDIDDVAFYGGDCPACSDYWQGAINILNFPIINFGKIHIVGSPIMSGTSGLGVGVILSANSASPGVVYNFSKIEADYLAQGMQILDNIQGVNITQSNFTGVNTGVYVPTGIAYGHDDQLMISDSQFNAFANAITISSPFRHTNIHDNYFVVPGNANAVFLQNYAMTDIHDNHFINVGGGGGNGIVFGAYGNDVSTVANNTTQFFTTGIYLQSGSQNVTLLPGNTGASNTNNVVNSGTNNTVPVSCPAGAPSASYTVVNGIPTHC